MANGRPWLGSDTQELWRLADLGLTDKAIGLKMHRERSFIAHKRAQHEIPCWSAMAARIKRRQLERRIT